MKEKLEYTCGCGRSYILFAEPNKPKKCLKCARILKLVEPTKEISHEPPPQAKQETIHTAPRSSPIGSMSHLEETWEYQYQEPGEYHQEPFTIMRFLKKIWMLFSFGKTTRRF